MRRGQRNIDGRLFIQAGCGAEKCCWVEASALRRIWRFVRIIFVGRDWKTDDDMIYVHGRDV